MEPALTRQVAKIEQYARSIYAKAYRRRDAALDVARTPDAVHRAKENFAADTREARPWYQLKDDTEALVGLLPKLVETGDVPEIERYLRKLLSSILTAQHLGTGDDYPEDSFFFDPNVEPPGGYFSEVAESSSNSEVDDIGPPGGYFSELPDSTTHGSGNKPLTGGYFDQVQSGDF